MGRQASERSGEPRKGRGLGHQPKGSRQACVPPVEASRDTWSRVLRGPQAGTSRCFLGYCCPASPLIVLAEGGTVPVCLAQMSYGDMGRDAESVFAEWLCRMFRTDGQNVFFPLCSIRPLTGNTSQGTALTFDSIFFSSRTHLVVLFFYQREFSTLNLFCSFFFFFLIGGGCLELFFTFNFSSMCSNPSLPRGGRNIPLKSFFISAWYIVQVTRIV